MTQVTAPANTFKRFNAVPATHAPGNLRLGGLETVSAEEITASNGENKSLGKLASVAASIATDGTTLNQRL